MQPSKIIPLIPANATPTTMPSAPAAWPQNAPTYFHVLGKPSGATCNLDCTYCFFLSKEKLYPNSRFRMTHDFLIGLSLDSPQEMDDTYRVDKGGV
jgi:sulfatase maturation enzyme AslB (radical SAM superfamily)